MEVERRLVALAADGVIFLMSGKASSIQRLRNALKTRDIPSTRLVTKAYWAVGKTGLD